MGDYTGERDVVQSNEFPRTHAAHAVFYTLLLLLHPTQTCCESLPVLEYSVGSLVHGRMNCIIIHKPTFGQSFNVSHLSIGEGLGPVLHEVDNRKVVSLQASACQGRVKKRQ